MLTRFISNCNTQASTYSNSNYLEYNSNLFVDSSTVDNNKDVHNLTVKFNNDGTFNLKSTLSHTFTSKLDTSLEEPFKKPQSREKKKLLAVDISCISSVVHADDNRERARTDNLARSKTAFMDLVANNVFLWMLTLTFDKSKVDRYDRKAGLLCFANWVRQCQRDYPDFYYLCVREFHKDGAIHFHVLCNIPLKSELIPYHEHVHGHGRNRSHYFDIKHWSYGFSLAAPLIDRKSRRKAANYCAKYISKGFADSPKGEHRYYASRDLKRPLIIRLLDSPCDFSKSAVAAILDLFSDCADKIRSYFHSAAMSDNSYSCDTLSIYLFNLNIEEFYTVQSLLLGF